MARFPNFLYSDSNVSPWAAFGSSLGQALFGDPAEQRLRANADAENDLRRMQIEKLGIDIDQANIDRDRKNAFSERLLALQSGTQLAPSPTGPLPTPAAAAPAAAAPGPYGDAFNQADAPMVPANTGGSSLVPAFAMDMVPDYGATVARKESSGDATNYIGKSEGLPRSPGATASGLYGFTDGTWNGAAGVQSAMDASPADQTMEFRRQTDQAYQALRQKLGRDPLPNEVYAYHHFGEGGGAQLLDAAPETPFSTLFSPETKVNESNPQLAGQTAGGWLQQQAGDLNTGQPNLGIQTAAGPGGYTPQPSQQPQEPQTLEEIWAHLNTYERNYVLGSPDQEKAMMDVMEKRAAAELRGEGTGAAWAGTGMPAQLNNHIRDYQMKAMRGEATPQDKFDYDQAVSQYIVDNTHYITTTDPKTGVSSQDVVYPNIPRMKGFVDPYGDTPLSADGTPGQFHRQSVGPGNKGVTEDQAKSRTHYITANYALPFAKKNYEALSGLASVTGFLSADNQKVVNFMQSPEYQQAKVAIDAIGRAYTYSVSGAQAGDEEVAGNISKITPEFGDSEAVLEFKKGMLDTYVAAIRERTAWAPGEAPGEKAAAAAAAAPAPTAPAAPVTTAAPAAPAPKPSTSAAPSAAPGTPKPATPGRIPKPGDKDAMVGHDPKFKPTFSLDGETWYYADGTQVP